MVIEGVCQSRRKGRRVTGGSGKGKGRKGGGKTYGAVDLDGDLAPGLHVSEVLGGSDVDALGERGGGEGKERDGELHCVEEEGKSGGFCEVKCRCWRDEARKKRGRWAAETTSKDTPLYTPEVGGARRG